MKEEQSALPVGEATPETVDWRGTSRFEVVRCLGRGGMGVVYEARDTERRQRVALKTLLHFDPASLFLLKQEFRTLADVRHPNLVRLHEFVAAEGERVFFSMELIRGTTFLAHVQKPDRRSGVPAETSDILSADPLEAARSGVQLRSTPPPNGGAPLSDPGARLPACPADFDRLRPALRQLVEGLRALHAAGKLHRDIKPSNVLVTPEGRVVLLDFGVSTELPRVADENLREQPQLVGTARYMAPEQAFGEETSPASDWYSVGVMLYEALVGRAPFEGSTFEVIQQKSNLDARAPSERADGVPPDLDAMCLALLETDPARRMTGQELLRQLGGDRASQRTRGKPLEAGVSSLIGREAQLQSLRDAFESTLRGRGVTVRVSGRAGMGKSALVQHFLDTLVGNGEALVLRGRAYERESVPYKAVDAMIDALSRHLMHVLDAEAPLALPPDTDALARLFPALRRVPTVGEIPAALLVDPQSVRRRAFGALRALFTTLARRQPLVLYIDDVHWGDRDSAALLLELVRPPAAPPMLLVLSQREEEANTAPFSMELRARWPAGAETRDVSVDELDPGDARRLSLAILGSEDEQAQTVAEAAARESQGSPFLIEELTRSSAGRLVAAAQKGQVTLEQLVTERLASLSADARRLMELIAVGGHPLPVSTVSDAAELTGTEDIVSTLSERRFVRTGLRDGREVVEPIHDRIRASIVALLSEATVREYHGRLARVLEATPGADAEAIAMHLFGTGENERAARFAARAAKRAASQLAFDQAARLYTRAVESVPDSSPQLAKWRLRLAEALKLAGRGPEAARVYSKMAVGASPIERADFERAAAEQLLMSGHIGEGANALHRILSSWGMTLPRSPLSTVFWLIVYRLTLAVRGLRFEERDAASVEPEVRARIDALHAVAMGISMVDVLLSACVQARHMRLALDKGHRFQVLRAADLEASILASLGGRETPREVALNAIVRRLAEGSAGSEVYQVFYQAKKGIRSFLRGHWKEAREILDAAYLQYPNNRGSANSNFYLFSLHSLWFLGDLVELAKRKAYMLADAEQRGDLYTVVNLSAALPVLTLLADDEVLAARASVSEAMSRWSQVGYSVQHWQAMVMEVFIELYSGNGERAYERAGRDARALKLSFVLKGQFVRGTHEYIRGLAAIAASSPDSASRATRLAEARQMAKNLEQHRMPWTAPLAAIVSGAASNADGDRAGAATSLRRAIDLARAADMPLYGAAARYQLGLLQGGLEGTVLIREAERAMRAEDVRSPPKFASMLVPGTWTPT